jgi:uncharacterized membrane protein
MKADNKTIALSLIALSVLLIITTLIIKTTIDSQGVFLCEAVEQNPALDMADCPAHNSSSSWMIISSLGIGMAILFMGFHLRGGAPAEPHTYKDADLSKLDNDEKTIYGMLKENEGASYQSDVVRSTGYSKVKVTRILDRMEQKGIIDRKRRGMTNLIVLR